VKFRRRKSDEVEAVDAPQPEAAEGTTTDEADPRADGPWDASEVRLDPDDPTKVDLGGLVVTGKPGLELQLQVDESSGSVAGVVLAGEEGAVELRPFAAPRNGDIWTDIRRAIAADVTQHGGTVDEAEGPWGTELRVVLPVRLPDGQSATQPSRVLGIAGPRWLLRATLFGKPALDPSDDGEVETALREVVVVRGSEPLPPGEPLPMRVPPNAQRIDTDQ
jgi:hypothetical protein